MDALQRSRREEIESPSNFALYNAYLYCSTNRNTAKREAYVIIIARRERTEEPLLKLGNVNVSVAREITSNLRSDFNSLN